MDWNTAVVEFVGGPFDGRTMTLRTGKTQYPPNTVYLPVEPHLNVDLANDKDAAYRLPSQARYESSGVMSDERHTWLYSYKGIQHG